MGERTKKPARRSGWRQWKADEARRVVEAWRASGLPLATFARKRGLCAERIRWWRQRLGDWSPPSEEAPRLIPATVTGSPPTATEMLRRHIQHNGMDELQKLLHEWERWSADLLESHLSYPVLVYFRSQHDNQSWLGALTSILDTAAFVIASLEGECVRQARLTFAMARHAIVDLALVLHRPPREPRSSRLPRVELAAMRALLISEGMRLREGPDVDQRLEELRRSYEPYVYSLSQRLLLPLPPWISDASRGDNWQISAWGQTPGFKRTDRAGRSEGGHF